MKLYRAQQTDNLNIVPWQCWTTRRADAEAYTDNPGFGGPVVIETDVPDDLNILDVTERSMLARALGLDEWDAPESWRDAGYRYPWEWDTQLSDAMLEMGYDAIQYLDDYPDGSTTICFLRAM